MKHIKIGIWMVCMAAGMVSCKDDIGAAAMQERQTEDRKSVV